MLSHRHIRATLLLIISLAAARNSEAQRAATHSSNIWGVTFAMDEASVATVARGEVRIWALPSGQLACRLDGSYYSARIAADGPSGYHITFVDYTNGANRALRAVRVDATTCAQTPVPVIAGAVGGWGSSRYTVTAPGGRLLHNGFATPTESRTTVLRSGERYTIAVNGRVQLESGDAPTVHETGTTVYTCTTRASNGEWTYHRIEGDGRAEKLASAKPDRYGAGGCGDLSLSADGAYLLDAAGTVVDLRRTRVLATYAMSQPTSVGYDPDAKLMVAGYNSGAVTVPAGADKPSAQVGGNSTHGYVSPGATWVAIASSLIDRPLVQLQSRRFATVVLDDAKSRPAADILGAQREAETQARMERERREIAAADAERAAQRARERASTEASAQQFMRQIADELGVVNDYRTLRHRGSVGGYETMHIQLHAGDVLVLGSEADGNVLFQVTQGTLMVQSIGRRMRTSGRAVTWTKILQDIEGELNVFAGEARVWVFVVRRADVKR